MDSLFPNSLALRVISDRTIFTKFGEMIYYRLGIAVEFEISINRKKWIFEIDISFVGLLL